MTAAYLGSTPQVWDLRVPDLSAAGFNPKWGFRADLPAPEWFLGAFGAGAFSQLVAPTEGSTITAAFMFGTPTAPAPAARAGRSHVHSRISSAARASIARRAARPR